MTTTFQLIYTANSAFPNPFGYSFGRARCNPLSDTPVKGGNFESRYFETQDDLINHLNEMYWMFFGTEDAQQDLKKFLKMAGKARKQKELKQIKFNMAFDTFRILASD